MNAQGKAEEVVPDRWDTEICEEGTVQQHSARTMFIGIANMYGNKEHDVCKYLGIDRTVHQTAINRFRELYKEAKGRIGDDTYYDYADHVRRFYQKLLLIDSYIKMNYKWDTMIRFEDWMTSYE